MERVLTVGGNRSTVPLSDFALMSIGLGKVFYVDYTNGDNGRAGTTPQTSVKTLTYALSLCTASRGDFIYLLPGHAESIASAGALAINKAGVTIIGIGKGSLQPKFTLTTATTADIDISAANVTIENVHFSANFADIVAAIDVNADDFTLRGCRFSETATNMNALIWIQDALVTASDRITVEGCEAVCLDAANTHFINLAGTGDGHKIIGNTLIGDWGTIAVGGAGVVTNIVILDNVLSNAATTNDSCINLASTTTGIVMRNMCAGGAAQANGVTATACALAENYYAVVGEDLSAILDPIAT